MALNTRQVGNILLSADKLLDDNTAAALSAAINELYECADLDISYLARDESRLKKWLRGIIIKSIKWYIAPLAEQQSSYNRKMASTIALLRDEEKNS